MDKTEIKEGEHQYILVSWKMYGHSITETFADKDKANKYIEHLKENYLITDISTEEVIKNIEEVNAQYKQLHKK